MRIIFPLLLLLLSASVQAQMYKWVDSSGKVHYTDQAPPANVKQKKLDITTSPAPVVATPGKKAPVASKTLADKEMDFNKRRKQADDAIAKQTKEAEEAKTAKENCDRARSIQRSLDENLRITQTNEKGERVFLDGEARQKELERAKKGVADWCK